MKLKMCLVLFMTYLLSHQQRLNGSNSGVSRSEASCLNYAKSCARGSRGFLKATLLADFTPEAMLLVGSKNDF
jgi:hypothetical protein